jgi:hypothetical protein
MPRAAQICAGIAVDDFRFEAAPPMQFMGSPLQPITLEDGVSAVMLSLVGTIILGTILLTAGHPGTLALMAFPSLLAGTLAHAAGISASANPRAVLVVCGATFYLHQSLGSLLAMG